MGDQEVTRVTWGNKVNKGNMGLHGVTRVTWGYMG